MMVHKRMRFVVVSGQLPQIAVDVVGVAALGFQLNGHVFDAEIQRRSDSGKPKSSRAPIAMEP